MTEAEIQIRIREIKKELIGLDLVSIRPLRAIDGGLGTDRDRAKIEEINKMAYDLREELAEWEAEL